MDQPAYATGPRADVANSDSSEKQRQIAGSSRADRQLCASVFSGALDVERRGGAVRSWLGTPGLAVASGAAPAAAWSASPSPLSRLPSDGRNSREQQTAVMAAAAVGVVCHGAIRRAQEGYLRHPTSTGRTRFYRLQHPTCRRPERQI